MNVNLQKNYAAFIGKNRKTDNRNGKEDPGVA
jgi:hypothetical protein